MDLDYSEAHIIDLYEDEKYQECIVLCEEVLKTCFNKTAKDFLAASLRKLGHYLEAIDIYNELIASDLFDQTTDYIFSNLVFRGDCYYELAKYQLALDDYNKALEIDPKAGSTWQRVAEAYSMMGNFDEADINIDRAIELSGKIIDTWGLKAIFYKLQGRTVEAFNLFSEIRKVYPNNDLMRNQQFEIIMNTFKKSLPDYQIKNRFQAGDHVFYLVTLKNEDGKMLYFGEGNIQKVYNTKLNEMPHFCYEFAEHEIIIDQKPIILPKRVVVDDNVFISNEELSEFLKNDGAITQID